MFVPRTIALAGFRFALALALGFPCLRLEAQGEARCARFESLDRCYERALVIAIDSVHRATARGDERGALWMRSKAHALFRETCDRGLGQGCYVLGRRVMSERMGDGAGMTQAADLFHRGCFARHPSADACNGLGDSYAYGVGRRVLEDSALALFQAGCDHGSATACFRAGARRALDRGVPSPQPSSVVAMADRACSRGSPGGCLNVGYYRETNPAQVRSKRPIPESVGRLYRDACHAGQLIACSNLGGLFLRAEWRIDSDSALRYLTWACTGQPDTARDRAHAHGGFVGTGMACNRLGNLFIAGKHVPADTARALRHFSHACTLFDTDGCVNLTFYRMRYEGRSELGVGDFYTTALACFEGNGYGCNNLAWLIGNVFGDSARAISFYSRACDGNHAPGCHNLAVALEPTGAARDSVLALYVRSCELEYAAACWALHERAYRAQRGSTAVHYGIAACRLNREYCRTLRNSKRRP